ncbi:hypothetical protein [Embleya sp. NPDC005971]|uniref:hypothetical protein n=1 Tax=Embleya sp. NPDC005971 TaxID=3156724 RepID=UPI0033F61A71
MTTTLNLSVEIDGVSRPLRDCDWVLRRPCGCAEAIMHAVSSLVTLTSEHEAWEEFYCDVPRADRRRRAVNAARKRGYTVALTSIDDAVRAWEARCPHGEEPEPGQQASLFDPTDPADDAVDVNA